MHNLDGRVFQAAREVVWRSSTVREAASDHLVHLLRVVLPESPLVLVHHEVNVDEAAQVQEVQSLEPGDHGLVLQHGDPLGVPAATLKQEVGRELGHVVHAAEVERGVAHGRVEEGGAGNLMQGKNILFCDGRKAPN